jgi:hypothetical protein
MERNWTQSKLTEYIDEEIEESLSLDYKGAGALQKTPGKRKEITKDVSAMANANGGVIIYGILEYQDSEKKHLPERLDPINRSLLSKEWLEHAIGNISPRIIGILIHPVSLDSGDNDVAYVVEIPKGTTAHQALDKRFYFRYNFESKEMDYYQIVDVMNRSTRPNVSIEFVPKQLRKVSVGKYEYQLRMFVENLSTQTVKDFQLVLSIPQELDPAYDINGIRNREHITARPRAKGGFRYSIRSKGVLFPEEKLEIGTELGLKYIINNWDEKTPTLNWILYADDMIPKDDRIPFSKLCD